MSDEAKTQISVGQRFLVAIGDIGFGGEGVARLDDFVVFVPFVMVGEEVSVEITEVKKQFARARPVEVIRRAPERVDPPCPYFGACGGCQYQHIGYEAQLSIKHKQVSDVLARLGGLPTASIDPVIPCPQPYGYRNRIMIRSQWNKFKQGLELGYLRHDNRLVVDVDECLIAEPALNAELRRIREHPPRRGGQKVVLRIAPEGWHVPRDSFFQSNFLLLPKLVEVVRDRFRSAATRHLVDAYCGVGFFSVELADLCESFAGFDVDQLAIQAARLNASARRLVNGQYVAGDAREALPGMMREMAANATTVLLDPPRKGCSPESLQLLREAGPAQIIYVSCHPATLARDLKALAADGAYELVKLVPLDMFPQTQHVECVADLRRRSVNVLSPDNPEG